ncbi:MAG: FAD-binding oxidoreductase [Pseudomonadota bacterium]
MTRPSDGLSYYRATANPAPEFPALEGDRDCDVCVIGAGYTGLSAALELAQRGYDVVVLESETVGWGASGRNGGQICTGVSCGIEKIEKVAGREAAKQVFDISEEAKDLIKARVETHKIDCDLKWGYLHAAPRQGDLDEMREEVEYLQGFGATGMEVLDRTALSDRLGSTIYHGATREEHAGHLHPLNYCLGLAEAAVKAGARIFEHTPVTAVETGGSPYASTARGRVRAKFMVVGGNAYLGKLIKPLYQRLMPCGSFILATEPLGENRARALIAGDEAVSDSNFIVDYYRCSADHRMLFGGRCSYSTLEPKDLGAFMRPRMLNVFPQLDDVKIDYAWGGYIGITMSRIPHVGRIGQNVYYAQGYSGQGVALSGMCGKLLAEAIMGQAERFDVMAQFKHQPFPGGPLRTPALVLGMLYYRLRDALS